MDISELHKLAFLRVKQMEPQNAGKILGCILLREPDDDEMVQLAYGSDAVVHAKISDAKATLAAIYARCSAHHHHHHHHHQHHHHHRFVMSRTKGGNNARKSNGKRSSGQQARKYVFQPGERTIPTKVQSAVVATSDESPMARVAVPVPGLETDPAGVRVLGWKITASSTDSDLRFNLGAKFGKQVTIHVPVEQRPNGKQSVPLILDVIGTVDQTYAIMFTNTVYYTVDALAH